MNAIKKRKVDNKGRVSLPVSKNKEIFFAKIGKTFILSEDEHELKLISTEIDNENKIRKLKALKEWFDLVESAGLSHITSKDIDDIIGSDLSKKVIL